MRNAQRLLRVTTESTFGVLSELSPKLFDVYRSDKGRHWVQHTRQDDTGRKTTRRRQIDAKAVDALMDRLTKLRIPAGPRFEMGCDGGFTELEMGGYGGKAHYRWWSVPPKGWEELNNIAGDVIRLFHADEIDEA